MLRLQKERDSSAQEVLMLQEKLELLQSQMAKATRDRELLLNETESSRERYDKANQNLLKLQVDKVEVGFIDDIYLGYGSHPVHPSTALAFFYCNEKHLNDSVGDVDLIELYVLECRTIPTLQCSVFSRNAL